MTVGQHFLRLDHDGQREYLKTRDIRAEKADPGESNETRAVRVIVDGRDPAVYPYSAPGPARARRPSSRPGEPTLPRLGPEPSAPSGTPESQLSMRQVEVSRTLVLDTPRHARAFFEALIADNLDLGRPSTWRSCSSAHPAVDRSNQGVTINTFWRRSRVKQYLKDGRALCIETVVN
jgi:hypothetical protein